MKGSGGEEKGVKCVRMYGEGKRELREVSEVCKKVKGGE